jgi:hypothetical protein
MMNVPPGKSYCAMRDEYVAMVVWWIPGENQRNLEIHIFQRHYFHYKSHMKSPGVEPKTLQWEASAPLLEKWRGSNKQTNNKQVK